MRSLHFRAMFVAIAAFLVTPAISSAVNLQAIEDRQEIEQLLARYSFALDTADADGYGAVFTEDAFLDIAGTPYHGRKEISGFVRDMRASLKLESRPADERGRRFTPIRHLVTNLLIEIKGNTATCDSFFTEIMSNGRDATGRGRQQSLLNVGRYQDDLVKQSGHWLIKRRLIISDMYGTLPKMDLSPFPQQAHPTDLSP